MKRHATRFLYFCTVLFICVLSGCVNDGSRTTSVGKTAENNSSAGNPIATIAALENALATAESELEVGVSVEALTESATQLAGELEAAADEDTAPAVANDSQLETPGVISSAVEVRSGQGGSLNITEAIPVARFSLSTVSTSRPSDILDEIDYFGGGGGCLCSGPGLHVRPCGSPDPDYPDPLWPYVDGEFRAGISVLTCGWTSNEEIAVTVWFPDGNYSRHSTHASVDGHLSYSYLSQKDPPEGAYELSFNGESGELSVQTIRIRSTSPAIYPLDYGAYFLDSFQANERVRLAGYQPAGGNKQALVGWQEFLVSDHGQLTVEIDEDVPITSVVAYGERSGTVNVSRLTVGGLISEPLTVERQRSPSITTNSLNVVPLDFRPPRIFDFYTCLHPCTTAVDNRIFPEGTTKIDAGWSFENFAAGSLFTRSWSVDGEEWVRYECVWAGSDLGSFDVTLSEPGGLRSGTWTVVMLVDGVELLREELVVLGSEDFWDPVGVLYQCK